MAWWTPVLPLITEAQTIEEGLTNLFTHLENEVKNGSGMTNPIGVVEELVAGLGDIAHALVANTPPAAPAPPPPPPPPPPEQAA